MYGLGLGLGKMFMYSICCCPFVHSVLLQSVCSVLNLFYQSSYFEISEERKTRNHERIRAMQQICTPRNSMKISELSPHMSKLTKVLENSFGPENHVLNVLESV